ncbi:MAG: histidine kinase [Mycobacterium sp.]|nr:histidine kinase [Mycobacterium sp.]
MGDLSADRTPEGEIRRRPMRARLLSLVLRPQAPPLAVGIAVAAAFIVAETLLVFWLKRIAPENAFGVLFLLGVLVVSAGWGFGLAVATSLASLIAYVYFHLETNGILIPTKAQDLLAVAIFLPVALLANTLGGQARLRAAEADQRRREADLAAELGRLTLRAGDLRAALDRAAQRLADVLGLPFAGIELESVPSDDHRRAVPLRDGSALLGTLLIPADLPTPIRHRLRRMVPALEALLAAARDREAISTALEASRREQEQFFDLTSDLLCIGGPVYVGRVNPAFERALGYSSSELLSRPFAEFIHPADRSRTRAVLDELYRSHGSAQFENRCIRSDGAPRWLEWNVVSDQGLLYAAARDVSDRRFEQDRLRQAQRIIEASHAEVSLLAEQQAALRRVATLVARGVAPSEVFPAAVAELARGLDVNHVALFRYDGDAAVLLVARQNEQDLSEIPVGERFSLDGVSVVATVLRTGRPARVNSYDGAPGSTAARVRGAGLNSSVGAPIIVDGRMWGVAIIGSSRPAPLAPDTEARIGDFADLVATAIANAETRAELTASRARIVAAADNARRRFERDLHDGAQQRIVSLGLELRAAEASVPSEQTALKEQLSHIVGGLAGVSSDLQEISRGIHPAILSRGGLGPAIKTLARRSTVPVVLDVSVGRRLPESTEVAAYYVVAEALANAAKHARASEVNIRVEAERTSLSLSIRDDGIGGAVSGKGSGLIGLTDRVEALGGHLEIESPVGRGTSLVVTIPLDAD